jgi:branched-chain amino acid transport system substrate-binding protein
MKLKLAVAIMLLITIMGCSGNITGDITKEDSIKIGVMAPFTGDLASYGEWAQDAMQIALDDINHTILGRPVELVYEDTLSNPKNAVTAARRLTEFDKVEVILGPVTSPNILASAPLAEENQVVMLTWVGSAEKITHAGDYIFRIRAPNKYETKKMADFMGKNNVKSVAVIYTNNEWGKSYLDSFKRYYDGEVKIELATEATQTDFRTELLKAREKKPDALYFILFPTPQVLTLNQKKELGIELPVFGTTITYYSDIREGAGENIEGIIFPHKSIAETSNEFAQRFEERTGKELSNHAENAYDALILMSKAIEEAGVYESDAIKDALYEVGQDYHGVSGIFSFDENGDVERPFDMLQYQDLEPVVID